MPLIPVFRNLWKPHRLVSSQLALQWCIAVLCLKQTGVLVSQSPRARDQWSTQWNHGKGRGVGSNVVSCAACNFLLRIHIFVPNMLSYVACKAALIFFCPAIFLPRLTIVLFYIFPEIEGEPCLLFDLVFFLLCFLNFQHEQFSTIVQQCYSLILWYICQVLEVWEV